MNISKLFCGVIASVMLVGCANPIPRSDVAVKFYDISRKEVRFEPQFNSTRSTFDYIEYTCEESDAIIITRKRDGNVIVSIEVVGNNCIKVELSKIGVPK